MKNATLFQVTNNEDFSQNMMGWMHGYVPVCKLQAVYTYVSDAANGISDIDICESVFRLGNTDGEGREYMHYSVSVGDVVNVGCEWYRLTGDGWDCITGKEQGAVGMFIKEREGVSLEYFTEELEAVEKEDSNMEAATNNTTVQEETGMNNETIILNGTMEERIVDKNGKFNPDGIKEVIVEMAEGMSNICGDMVEDVSPHVEQVKGYLVSVSGILNILGLRKLKSDFDKIIYSGLDENLNPTQIDKMVKQINSLFREEIKRLNYFATDKTLAQSLALKCMIGDTYTDKNIFECIFATLLNVIKRAVKFIKEKYNLLETKAKSMVIKAILKGIRCLFGALIQGGLIIIKFIGHGISFIIAGVTAVGYWVYNTLKKLFTKIAALVSNKMHGDIDEDDLDDFFEDAEEDVTIEPYEE